MPPEAKQSTPQPNPISRLVSGPASAIQNSTQGLRGSPSSCDTPPSTNNAIPFTFSPFVTATSECASSCSKTEQKKSSTVPTASNPAIKGSTAGKSGSKKFCVTA